MATDQRKAPTLDIMVRTWRGILGALAIASAMFAGLLIGSVDGPGSHAEATPTASLAADFGSDSSFSLRPEISVSYRNVLSYDSAPGSARFAGGTTAFLLEPGREPESALVGGVGFNISSEYLNMKLGYDTEIADGSTTHYGSITLRLAFW